MPVTHKPVEAGNDLMSITLDTCQRLGRKRPLIVQCRVIVGMVIWSSAGNMPKLCFQSVSATGSTPDFFGGRK